MEILVGTEFGPKPLKGSGRSSYASTTVVDSFGGGITGRQVTTLQGNTVITNRVIAQITNPNLFLANQLGLIDIALPWKLLPFSFVVDWFINVEQVLSSVTDWYGVSLIHPHRSVFLTGRRNFHSYSWSTAYLPGGGSTIVWGRSIVDQNSTEWARELGFSQPTLKVRPFKGFSVQRGVQAISLVLAVLGK
jgi:hypothetical protein